MVKKMISVALFLAFFLGAAFSGWKIYTIQDEYRQSRVSYDRLSSDFSVAIPTEEAREYAPIQVDFEALKGEGEDIVGWIYCEDTKINYPVVQASNNDYYLKRLPNGSFSGGGSIFMDYRDDPDLRDWNTVLYGHNMNDDSMFGDLSYYREQKFYDAHPVMYYLTPERDYKLELIGGYTTASTSDTYSEPLDREERDALIRKAVENSKFQTEVEPGEEDRLMTLSTCTYEYDEARFVLVGILRELDRKEAGTDA